MRPILVGVNDSPSVDAALRWAVDEARVRKAPMRFVYAYKWQFRHGDIPAFADVPEAGLYGSRDVAEQTVVKMVDRARELAPELDVGGAAVDGHPVEVLVDESARASVLVLGSRHLSGFGSAMLGSVSVAAAARAMCPVVVVRGPAGAPDEGAGVIAGVDGTESSETVLAFAFDHASRHGVPLRAVLCWHPDLLAVMMWRPEPPAPARVEAWLSETVAGWRERYPDVEVHTEVVREHPSDGLLMASMSQHLLVVGSCRRHGLAGTLLGSVTQGVLHHATCPVAVVPV